MPRAGYSTGRALLCAAGAIKMGERSVRARERPSLEPALGYGRADTEQTNDRSGNPRQETGICQWIEVRENAIRPSDGSTGIYGVVGSPDIALVIPADGDRCIWSSSTGTRSALGIPSGTADQRLAADPAVLAARELRVQAAVPSLPSDRPGARQ